MPLVKFQQRPNSERLEQYPPMYRAVYVAEGEDDGTVVEAQAIALLAPQLLSGWGILYRQPLKTYRLGHKLYDVEVEYGQRRWGVNEYTFRAKIGGQPIKIMGGYETVFTTTDAPDFKNLIGVGLDGKVEGVDEEVAILDLEMSIKYPVGVANLAYIKALYNIQNKTNDRAWLGFATGEVVYRGSDIGDGTNVEMEATHRFSCSPNITGASLCGLTVNKGGWEVLWFLWERTTAVAGGVTYPVTRAKHAYSVRTKEKANFAPIFGF